MERFSLFWGIAWFGVVKGWHFAEFAILTFLTARVIQWWRGRLDTKSIAIAMLVCVLFAASDEWHQTFVPDRFGTFQDVLIDSLGVFAAGTYLLHRSRKASLRSVE
jgi:VanZ family protein